MTNEKKQKLRTIRNVFGLTFAIGLSAFLLWNDVDLGNQAKENKKPSVVKEQLSKLSLPLVATGVTIGALSLVGLAVDEKKKENLDVNPKGKTLE